MNKNLIIYFSRAGENYGVGDIKIGNTHVIASYIQELIDADMFEVVPKIPYPSNYTECTKVAKDELNTNARPELKEYLEDISMYDTIYIGSPNWWGTMPMALVNQLERLDFTGKNIRLFATHEGSGLGNILNDAKKICIGANFLPSLAIQGSTVHSAKKQVEDWLK